MRPRLTHSAPLYDENAVGIADCAQPVGNDEYRHATLRDHLIDRL